MEDLGTLLSLAQEYWVITLIVSMIALSIFTQLVTGPSRTTVKFNASGKRPSIASNISTQLNSDLHEVRLELDSSDAAFAPIITALQSGDKITAIKLLREAKGLSLSDAKLFIDAIYPLKGKISN